MCRRVHIAALLISGLAFPSLVVSGHGRAHALEPGGDGLLRSQAASLVAVDASGGIHSVQQSASGADTVADALADAMASDFSKDVAGATRSLREQVQRGHTLLQQEAKDTVVFYMTHINEPFYEHQAWKFALALGANFTVTSPYRLGHLQSMPDSNPTQFYGKGWPLLSSPPGEAGNLLGYTLQAMLDNPQAAYCWVFEHDVYFTDPSDIADLVRSHADNDADLIAVDIFNKTARPEWLHWNDLATLPFEPGTWLGSFAPVMRVSRELVVGLFDFELANERLAFFEPLLPTLAASLGLKSEAMDERFGKNLRFRPCWTQADMREQLQAESHGHFFHPVKVQNGSLLECDEPAVPSWFATSCRRLIGEGLAKLSKLAVRAKATGAQLQAAMRRAASSMWLWLSMG